VGTVFGDASNFTYTIFAATVCWIRFAILTPCSKFAASPGWWETWQR
jgi:hypothetical protein